jgi:hypothetical protein
MATITCGLCHDDIMDTLNKYSCCCGNTMCSKCISGILTASLTGLVDLFPKCSFCRTELSSVAFNLNKEIANTYASLRTTVVGTPFNELKKIYCDGKHYVRRCAKCHLCFTVDKECAVDVDMLPIKCGICTEDITKKIERQCKKCKHGLVKEGGCNSVACSCGARMCWLCGELVFLPHVGKADIDHYLGNYTGKYCVNTRPCGGGCSVM